MEATRTVPSSGHKSHLKHIGDIKELRTLSMDVHTAVLGERRFRRHTHNDGSIGGFVADTARASGSVYIGPNALVLDKASVSGDVQLYNNSCISGNAQVSGNVMVYGNGQISGNAEISGHIVVLDNACITGDAKISNKAGASPQVHIFGPTCISGKSGVSGTSILSASTKSALEYLRTGPEADSEAAKSYLETRRS